MRRILLALSLLLVLPVHASAESDAGEVRMPLPRYDNLMGSGSTTIAPVRWSLSTASLRLTVQGTDRPSASGELTLTVQGDGSRMEVPLLPSGTSVTAATLDGSPIGLAQRDGWLVLPLAAAEGSVQVRLVVDAVAGPSGWSLPIPLAPAPSTELSVTLPSAGLEATAVPATAVRISGSTLTATVPAASGVQVSWTSGARTGHTLSRAEYEGELRGEAVRWTARYGVEVDGSSATLALLPTDVALVDLSVDGKEAPIAVEGQRFVARVRGPGRHDLVATFEVPVQRGDGPPKVALSIPRVPVSRFSLRLPGDKEVSVEPASSVDRKVSKNVTTATVHVPMTDAVVLSWSEAIPEAVTAELRANADLFHTAHAEEGVMVLRTLVDLQVTRGSTNSFVLDVPADLEVTGVSAPTGGVADWRITRPARGKAGVLTVFFDRAVDGGFRFAVSSERTLPKVAEPVGVPLLTPQSVNRSKGMVALLASKELTLEPKGEEGFTRVGENQLPAFAKQDIELTIAHTFKFGDANKPLLVLATTPERREGRFGAQVDTLISLGEVTLEGAATIEVDVKSGAVDLLRIALPKGVNFGGLTAPSLREHTLTEEGDRQIVEVAFTQELEGRFRIELRYEQILGEAKGELGVPTVQILGAEVEQGRIAVEALAAVEVQAGTVQNLSTVDVAELPRQLVLQTTNPILLAYKYVQVSPPYRLGLTVTRHREIDVQGATIEDAAYHTLVTRDGLAVTTARFTVRNRREQFLRVGLPRGSEVWSATVDGAGSKPALAEDADAERPQVLVKIINAERAFTVELVYATPIPSLGPLGRVGGELPTPDLVATSSTWDLYLPAELQYGRPRGDMDYVGRGGITDLSAGFSDSTAVRVQVPTDGVRLSFRKLYANQGGRAVRVRIPYLSVWGARIAWGLQFAAGLALWLGLLAGVRGLASRRIAGTLGGLGLLVSVAVVALLDQGAGASIWATLLALVLIAAALAQRRMAGGGPGGGPDGSDDAWFAPPAPAGAPPEPRAEAAADQSGAAPSEQGNTPEPDGSPGAPPADVDDTQDDGGSSAYDPPK